MARDAIKKPNTEYELSISVNEARNLAEEYTQECFQTWWDQQTSKYKIVQPKVTKKPFFTTDLRSQDVVMTRLLLGRCRLNDQLYKLGLHSSGLCDRCAVPETVEHFLLGCTSMLAKAIATCYLALTRRWSRFCLTDEYKQ